MWSKLQKKTLLWYFCLKHLKPVSSPRMTVHPEPCKKGVVEVSVHASEQGEKPRVPGVQVKQISLFWAFELQSLKCQLVGMVENGNFNTFGISLPFSKR